MDSNRYEELKPLREAERAAAVLNGQIRDPSKPQRLDQAVKLVGTCMEMCPEFERHQREYDNSSDRWERFPDSMRIDPRKAVKAFHRPAAGNEEALPSDIRPPIVLKRTLDYLFHDLLPSAALFDTHGFIRDRTRAIRQDFTVQNERGRLAIECHERIARYHILCLHDLRDKEGTGSYQEAQELEQLRKVLQSLNEFYDDLPLEIRKHHTAEAEFRAYHLLTHIRDSDVLRSLENLPRFLFDDPCVRIAVDLFAMVQRSNMPRGRSAANSDVTLNAFSRLFKRLASPEVSFLQAATLEPHFRSVILGAVKAVSRAQAKYGERFPLKRLAQLTRQEEIQLMDLAQAMKWDLTMVGRDIPNLNLFRQQIDESNTSHRLLASRAVSTKRPLNIHSILDGNVPLIFRTHPGHARLSKLRPRESSLSSPQAALKDACPAEDGSQQPRVIASADTPAVAKPPLLFPSGSPGIHSVSITDPATQVPNSLSSSAMSAQSRPLDLVSPGGKVARLRSSDQSITHSSERAKARIQSAAVTAHLLKLAVTSFTRTAAEVAMLKVSERPQSATLRDLPDCVPALVQTTWSGLSVIAASHRAHSVACEVSLDLWRARSSRTHLRRAWIAWLKAALQALQTTEADRRSVKRFWRFTSSMLPQQHAPVSGPHRFRLQREEPRLGNQRLEDNSEGRRHVASLLWKPGVLLQTVDQVVRTHARFAQNFDVIALIPSSMPTARGWVCCKFGLSADRADWSSPGCFRIRVIDAESNDQAVDLDDVALILIWRDQTEPFVEDVARWLRRATRVSRWIPVVLTFGWSESAFRGGRPERNLSPILVEDPDVAFAEDLLACATAQGFRQRLHKDLAEPLISLWLEIALVIARLPTQGVDLSACQRQLVTITKELFDTLDMALGENFASATSCRRIREFLGRVISDHASFAADSDCEASVLGGNEADQPLPVFTNHVRNALEDAITTLGDRVQNLPAPALESRLATFRHTLNGSADWAAKAVAKRRKRAASVGSSTPHKEHGYTGAPVTKIAKRSKPSELRALVNSIRQ